jgi:2-C-methyl-D-erythritol 4-phosphate cytidylyltransferase
MNRIGIILLAGSGVRLYPVIHEKKQFYPVSGKALFLYSVEAFLSSGLFSEIVLVADSDDLGRTQNLVRNDPQIAKKAKISYVSGGKDRNESVLNSLLFLRKRKGNFFIFIHDSDRPLVSQKLLKVLAKGTEKYEALTPVIPVHDSLLRQKGKNISYIDRSNAFSIQTPQVFDFRKILKVYINGYDPEDTDDFAKAVRAGMKAHTVRGEAQDFKITEKDDLELFQSLTKGENRFDVFVA